MNRAEDFHHDDVATSRGCLVYYSYINYPLPFHLRLRKEEVLENIVQGVWLGTRQKEMKRFRLQNENWEMKGRNEEE